MGPPGSLSTRLPGVNTASEVTTGIYRLGTEWVNWYLLEGDGGLTVVDCGLSAYYEQLPAALAELGRSLEDVKAIVLTHYHSDHVGSAERIRNHTGAAVLAPALDADGVRTGKVPTPKGFLRNLWRARMLRYLGHALSNGGASVTPVNEVDTYCDGETLAVPGSLRAVAAPGHTMGQCALLAADHGVLFAGDALGTMSFVGEEDGPTLPPVNEDHALARRSLEGLRSLEATHVCVGHGDPFAGSPEQAVAAALG